MLALTFRWLGAALHQGRTLTWQETDSPRIPPPFERALLITKRSRCAFLLIYISVLTETFSRRAGIQLAQELFMYTGSCATPSSLTNWPRRVYAQAEFSPSRSGRARTWQKMSGEAPQPKVDQI